MLTIPVFAAGYGLLLLGYIVPMAVYVVKRNSTVELHHRVLTPSHMRHMLAGQLGKMGVDMGAEGKAAHEQGAPVEFTALGGTEQQNQANIIWARLALARVWWPKPFAVRRQVHVGLHTRRGGRAVSIDGVWHEAEGQDRESGDNVLSVYKKMELNVDDAGSVKSADSRPCWKTAPYMGMIISQGTQTGERVIIQIDRPTEDFKTLRDLGMRENGRPIAIHVVRRDRHVPDGRAASRRFDHHVANCAVDHRSVHPRLRGFSRCE